MVSSLPMRRHLRRRRNGIVALVVMALLPLPMRGCLAVVDNDGDGYGDLLEQISPNTIKVYYSKIRRTDKLKSVTNPLGGKFTIDYKVQKVDYNNPNPKWVMSSLAIDDNYDKVNDGEDVYRITNRGGKGVKTLNITEKTGALIAINAVTDEDDLMIINKSGLTIRMEISDLRVMGRATQGVRLINIKGNDSIAAVTKVLREDEEVVLDENGDISDAETGTDIDSTEEEIQE